MKKQVNYKSVNNTKIDINSLYNELREALATRNSLEEKQRNLWSIIKRSKKDLNFEMNKIDIKIGENTHKINMIISKLSHYNKTHKAMSMAKDYLNKEILIGTNLGGLLDTALKMDKLSLTELADNLKETSLKSVVNIKDLKIVEKEVTDGI